MAVVGSVLIVDDDPELRALIRKLSEAETAQVLGWPVGTVKSRLSRALDRLRAKLDKPPRPHGKQP